jgi:oligopeptide transport system ATP-binding protein
MYRGKIVELADSDDLYEHPFHPYTKSLLSAAPQLNPITERRRVAVSYDPDRDHDYTSEKPSLREVVPGHYVLCSTSELKRYRARVIGTFRLLA